MDDFQWSYGGLTVGDGTRYDVAAVDGLEDFTARTADQIAANRWGSFPTPDQVQAKGWSMEIEVLSADGVLPYLQTAFGPPVQDDPTALQPFRWKYPGQVERRMMARCRHRAAPVTVDTVLGIQMVHVEMWAPDPRAYSDASHYEALTPYGDDSLYLTLDVGSGANLAKDLDVGSGVDLAVDLAGTVGGGTLFAENAGNTTTWPKVTFIAPAGMGHWRLRNLTTGGEADFIYPLGSGQQLVVDFGLKAIPGKGDAVTIDGAPYYPAWVHPRIPLALPAGVSEMRLDVIDGDETGAMAIVEWADAWI